MNGLVSSTIPALGDGEIERFFAGKIEIQCSFGDSGFSHNILNRRGIVAGASKTRYVDDLKSPIYYIAGLPEMVSAMKTVLKDSGVSADHIRAEEFSGFSMDHRGAMGQQGSTGRHDATHSKKRMRPLLIVALVLMIIVAVNLHAVGIIFLSKIDFGAFSLNNPIFSAVIGLFFAFALFKLKHVLSFLHRKKKQSAPKISKG